MKIHKLTKIELFQWLLLRMKEISHCAALAVPCFMHESAAATTVSPLKYQLAKTATVSSAVENWLTSPSR